jgi:sRNA-binding carbon storage regulator CsrA
MLVITRREGEEVVIGDPAHPYGIVRVAFSFPREIDVHRREVAEQILADKPIVDVVGTIRPAAGGDAT